MVGRGLPVIAKSAWQGRRPDLSREVVRRKSSARLFSRQFLIGGDLAKHHHVLHISKTCFALPQSKWTPGPGPLKAGASKVELSTVGQAFRFLREVRRLDCPRALSGHYVARNTSKLCPRWAIKANAFSWVAHAFRPDLVPSSLQPPPSDYHPPSILHPFVPT